MTCRSCGNDHQPWIRCEVAARLANVVVNEETPVVNAEPMVVNRNRDRHKMTPERKEYVRLKMREYREKKRAG